MNTYVSTIFVLFCILTSHFTAPFDRRLRHSLFPSFACINWTLFHELSLLPRSLTMEEKHLLLLGISLCLTTITFLLLSQRERDILWSRFREDNWEFEVVDSGRIVQLRPFLLPQSSTRWSLTFSCGPETILGGPQPHVEFGEGRNLGGQTAHRPINSLR